MFYRLTVIFISLLITLNNFGQQVYKMGQTGLKTAEGLYFYSLPRTSLLIKVVCTHNKTFAGPYFAYAEELLGIKNLPSEDKSEWRIDSILIQTIQEADPEAVYAVQTDKKFSPEKLLKFSQSGLIFDYSSNENATYNEKASLDLTSEPEVKFDEYSINGFVAESFDTIYKTVIKDTMYVKIPVLKPKTALKTLKEKAKDAADVIAKIRARKYELLMAEDDPYAEANVLKYAIAELDKIENAYIEMFTGKIVSKKYTFLFNHTPDIKDQNVEVFRFSSSNGINTGNQASPVFLAFDKEGRTRGLKDWLNNIPSAKESLYYRIPDAAVAKIIYKGQVIAFKRVFISQFGVAVPYPNK